MQNEHLKCKGCLQEISFQAKWNIFNSVYGQYLIAAYLKYPKMKLNVGHFDRNENTMKILQSDSSTHANFS